jgi:hypothetical protein
VLNTLRKRTFTLIRRSFTPSPGARGRTFVPLSHTHTSRRANVCPSRAIVCPRDGHFHVTYSGHLPSLSPHLPITSTYPAQPLHAALSPRLTNLLLNTTNHHQSLQKPPLTETAGPHTPPPATTVLLTAPFFFSPSFHYIFPQPSQPHFRSNFFCDF